MTTKYAKLQTNDAVVIATPSPTEGASAPQRSGRGMAADFLVVLGMMAGTFMYRDSIFEKNIYVEVGSGSSAMLLGPFAGSGAAAVIEEIEEIEEAVLEWELEIIANQSSSSSSSAPSSTTSSPTSTSSSNSSTTVVITKADETTSTKQTPSTTSASVDTPSGAPTETVAVAAAVEGVTDNTAVVLNEGGDPVSPDTWTVTFATTVVGANGETQAGTSIVIKVIRAWAPLGADHFYALVQDGFYTEAAFFRVVPNFVVQFGIAGIPSENKKWSIPIKDDPVLQSNKVKTLVYATAGPNTRTSQLFINYKDNTNLDSQGFAPFATVVDGFEYAQDIFNPTPGSSNGVDQDQYEAKGNDWIKQNYPHIDFIVNATISK